MRTVVTGGAGFIGSHLVQELADRGHEVVCIDNFSTGKKEWVTPLDVKVVKGDIRDKQTVDQYFEKDDYIFHLAAVTSIAKSVENPNETSQINCTGTANVLEAALRADAKGVTVASSAAVYPDGRTPLSEDECPIPKSPYGLSKLWTERLSIQFNDYYGLKTNALRYFNIYGPRQPANTEQAAVIPKFVNLMLNGKSPIIYGDGEQTRDFLHVNDVVQANIKTMEQDVSGEIFNVGSGKPTSINKLVNAINEVLGTEIDPIYEEPREEEVKHSYADMQKSKADLNFSPSVDLKSGIRSIVEYMKKG